MASKTAYDIVTGILILASVAVADFIGRFAIDIGMFPGYDPLLLKATFWAVFAIATYAIRSVNKQQKFNQRNRKNNNPPRRR